MVIVVLGRSFFRRFFRRSLIIKSFLCRRSTPRRNDSNGLSIELDMHNRQQSAGGAETDHSVSWLFISTRVLKNKQRVVEDSHRLFEGDAVLTLVLRSLRFIPFKRRTTVFEEPVHRQLEYHVVFTM